MAQCIKILNKPDNQPQTAQYSNQETGEFSINQIFGSRILVGNLEWRVPLSGPERLGLIISNIFLTELSLFGDAGVAWNSSSQPVWKQEAASPDERVPFLSTGLSLRVNLLGAMIIEAYYALPWRGDRFEKGVFWAQLRSRLVKMLTSPAI
jgi:hypothetical protein